jgi:hypothetical protein
MPKHDFSLPATELAKMLARRAEAVCRHYLPAGRREGHYWLVGMFTTRRGGLYLFGLVAPARGRGRRGTGRTLLRARMVICWISSGKAAV